MTGSQHLPLVPADSAYIAHLWEHPGLTVAIFSMQVHNPAAYTLYQEAGIEEQIEESLAGAEGFLGQRHFEEASGGMLLQYWRSHDDLASFARRLPHMGWWKWLIDNQG